MMGNGYLRVGIALSVATNCNRETTTTTTTTAAGSNFEAN
jgi:hypothetical protein